MYQTSFSSGLNLFVPAGKRIFVGKKTITASSDYKTGTFDYVIRSFSYKTRTCGFSLP